MGRTPGSRNGEGSPCPLHRLQGLTFRNCGLGACGRQRGRSASRPVGPLGHSPTRPDFQVLTRSPHYHTSGPGPKGSVTVTSQDVPRRWRRYTPEPLGRRPLGWGQERKLDPRRAASRAVLCGKSGEAQGSGKALQEEASPGGHAQWSPGSRGSWRPQARQEN